MSASARSTNASARCDFYELDRIPHPTNKTSGIGRLHDYRTRCAYVGVVDLTRVQRKIAFEDQVHGRAAWQLRFRAAREQNRGEPRQATDSGTDTCALAATSDSTNARARDGRGGYSLHVFSFATGTGDFS